MRRVNLSGFALVLLVVASAFWWQGCGLDPPKRPTPPILLPVFPPESPKDVLDCMAYAYNQFDYEYYYGILHQEFLFFIDSDDIDDIPSELQDEPGVWYYQRELDIARNMLDRNFIPFFEGASHPELQIDNMEALLDFSGEMEPTNLEGAPDGTLQSKVNFDLSVNTKGGTTYSVNSRPTFYFSPDSTASPVTWSIWRIEDAPNTANPT